MHYITISKFCRLSVSFMHITIILGILIIENRVRSELTQSTFEVITNVNSNSNSNVTFGCFEMVHPVYSTIHAVITCFAREDCVSVTDIIEHNKTAWLIVDCGVDSQNIGGIIPVDNGSGSPLAIWSSASQNNEVVNPCLNGGTLLDGVCKCVNAWIGELCDTRPVNCLQMRNYGYLDSWHTWIDENGEDKFLFCAYGSGSGTVKSFFFKSQGKYECNFTMDEFIRGWYFSTNNYFIGLKQMYDIVQHENQNGVRAVVRFRLTSDDSGVTVPMEWEYQDFTFTMADTGDDYAYDYSTSTYFPSGIPSLDVVGDCLALSKYTPFSAEDNDRDVALGVNCAAQHGAGWWFGDCTTQPICSPFGLIPQHADSGLGYPGLMLLPNFSLFDYDSIPYEFVRVSAYIRHQEP